MGKNARYLAGNDKGSGTRKGTSVAGKSAAGGSVTFGSDGTIKYAPVAGWQGKDSIQYTVQDGLGATDTGVFHIQVGSGTSGSLGGSTGGSPSPAPVKILAMGDATPSRVPRNRNKEAGSHHPHTDHHRP